MRFLNAIALTDDFRQMRFIAGPRQVGKTTLAKKFLKEKGCAALYYNWDKRDVRQRYRQEAHFFHADAGPLTRSSLKWICFDEIHKYPKWKNLLKDFFDSFENEYRFIVTGSARLDLLRRAGDSLTGRYFLYRLLPLSLSEVERKSWVSPEEDPQAYLSAICAQPPKPEGLKQLLNFSGFPEPFYQGRIPFHRNWQEEYLDTLAKGDLRDLTQIRDIENVIILLKLLAPRIGAPLSIHSLREDLEVSYNAAKNYIRSLILTYLIFEILPYSKKIHRAVKKEKKVYFFDWSRNLEESKRFENYVAVELKNRVELWTMSSGHKFELFYVRTRDGKETDFLILRNEKPYLLLEAKLNEEQVEGHHQNHARVLGNIPLVQVVQKSGILRSPGKACFVISAERFF